MAHPPLRIGLIGAGANTRSRHIPGLREQQNVTLAAVCNRRPGSTAAVAREYGIPRTYERWQDLVADPEVDAVVIGTWPYLHCPITLAALKAGKHVLTEARLSMNAAEAHRMHEAAQRHAPLVAQVVPSPYGLKANDVIVELLQGGFLGELREFHLYARNSALADPAAPLSWRQDASLSGYNMLTLGILHETVLRWLPPPVRVLAQAHAFIPSRIDPESGARRPVGTPDNVQVLTILENGARGLYQFSGVAPFGQGMGIWLYGTEGVLHYDFTHERVRGASKRSGGPTLKEELLEEIPVPADKARQWRVEAEFVDSIRNGMPVRLTDFAAGVRYMEFTEAVARSAEEGVAIDLPLEEFADDFKK